MFETSEEGRNKDARKVLSKSSRAASCLVRGELLAAKHAWTKEHGDFDQIMYSHWIARANVKSP